MSGAPVRFLALMLGGWISLRLLVLGIGFMEVGDDDERAVPATASAAPSLTPPNKAGDLPERVDSGPDHSRSAAIPIERRQTAVRHHAQAAPPRALLPFRSAAAAGVRPGNARPRLPFASSSGAVITAPSAAGSLGPPPPAGALLQIDAAPLRGARRWSGSAWLLARGAGGAALAPGGTLGGSQAGARLLYRVNSDAARSLSLSARLYAPLRRTAGAEVAAGLDWRPIATLPLHLLAERRQRLGRDGRSAWSIAAYGGASADLGGGIRLDAYAQAGIVGMRARDGFVDGAARFSAPLGPLEAGAAVWGAAQPGASRIDIGPQLTLPIRGRGASLRLSAEYRFRIAGDVRPDTGPALALGVDF